MAATFPRPFYDTAAIAALITANKLSKKGFVDESEEAAITRLVPSATSQSLGDGTNIIANGNNNSILSGVNNTLDQENSSIIASNGMNTATMDDNYRNSEQLYLNNLYSDGGYVYLRNLPTSDPEILDQLWNNAGVLTVSAGPTEV